MPPRLTGLTVGGTPAPWAELGFAVDEDGLEVGEVRIAFDPDAPAGITGWSWDTLELDELDGIVTTTATAPPAGPAHPNGVVGLDHVVVASPDLDRTRAAFDSAGLDFRRERDAGQLRQAFYVAGPLLVEVAGPASDPDGLGPSRLWGVTAVAEDLDALAARLGDRLGDPGEAVQAGRRIATLRREAGLGVPLAFMTPRVRS
jgi:hypothetical protein